MDTTSAGQTSAVFCEPGTARSTWAMAGLFEHLLEGDQERLGVALVTQPPGVATPLHRHTREAEAFFMLEGHVQYRAGDEVFELRPESFIYLPAGLPHAFRIRGDAPARFLAIVERVSSSTSTTRSASRPRSADCPGRTVWARTWRSPSGARSRRGTGSKWWVRRCRNDRRSRPETADARTRVR